MIYFQTGVGHIIVDAHGEVIFWLIFKELLKDRFHHRRGKLFGGEAIAAADHLRQRGNLAQRKGLGQGGDHILIERFTGCAYLFGTIQYCNGFHGFWQCFNQMACAEWTEQTHSDHAQFGTRPIEHIDSLFNGLRSRTHYHNHLFGIFGTMVIKQLVPAACQLSQFIHGLLNNTGNLVIKRIGTFTTLEIDIRILCRTTDKRIIRVQGAFTVCINQLVINHGSNLLIRNQRDLVYLMRGTEAIKEVDERYTCFQRGRMADECCIMRFLY